MDTCPYCKCVYNRLAMHLNSCRLRKDFRWMYSKGVEHKNRELTQIKQKLKIKNDRIKELERIVSIKTTINNHIYNDNSMNTIIINRFTDTFTEFNNRVDKWASNQYVATTGLPPARLLFKKFCADVKSGGSNDDMSILLMLKSGDVSFDIVNNKEVEEQHINNELNTSERCIISKISNLANLSNKELSLFKKEIFK